MAVRKKVKANKNRVSAMNKMKTIRRLQSKIRDVKKVEDALKSEKKKFENIVKKQVQCPVCYDVPRKGPIFACPNGHIVCQNCKRGKCPICRVKIGNNKSIVAVALIENIFHDCKFDGCDEEHTLDMIENHEKYCNHRTVTCPYAKCNQTIKLTNIRDHLGPESRCCRNSLTEIGVGSFFAESFHFRDYNHSRKDDFSLPMVMFLRSGALFALCMIKSGEYFHFTVVMFEPAEVCSAINMEIEVYERNSHQSPDTRESAKLRCKPCSIDESKSNMKHLGLTVHHKVMENMILRGDRFKFIVRITFF